MFNLCLKSFIKLTSFLVDLIEQSEGHAYYTDNKVCGVYYNLSKICYQIDAAEVKTHVDNIVINVAEICAENGRN